MASLLSTVGFEFGDIGSIDGDGFVTLHGRKDDLIDRGGEKIAPAEIDNALMGHPGRGGGRVSLYRTLDLPKTLKSSNCQAILCITILPKIEGHPGGNFL